MEDIKIIHDNNIEEIILINYFTSLVEKSNKEKGEFILENDILKIKWENNLYEEYIKEDNLNDELYVYKQLIDENIETINIIHDDWIDDCIIKNNIIYRSIDKDEFGKYKYINNLLIIYWEKWNYEIFYLINNNSYKLLQPFIKIHHTDWIDICYLTDENIGRKSNENELGTYLFESNKLIINWKDWNPDTFIKLDNEYYHENLIKNIIIIDKNYILINNKLYDQFIFIANIEFNDNDNNKVIIKWINNNIYEEYFYQYQKDNSIKFFTNQILNIILVKDNYLNYTLHFLDNEIKSIYKKGKIILFNDIENSILINWENSDESEKYILINDKYYYSNYLELNNKNVLIITEKDKINVKLNIFDNYFITENNLKIYFLKYQNIFYILDQSNIKKFYLDNFLNNYLLIIESIFNKININDSLNGITDIDSYLYSSNSLKILHNNLFFNQYSNKNINNPININNYIKIYENLIFIINLDNLNHLENVLESIPKISNILINLKFEYNIESLINNYTNLIITKSYNNINYFILKNIVDEILIEEKINNCNIFYINNDNNIDCNIIDLPNYKNNTLYYNNSSKYIIQNNNFLYDLIFLTTNYIEIIIIFIFFYLFQKYLYDICNNNFIINSDLLYKLMENKFDKLVYSLT